MMALKAYCEVEEPLRTKVPDARMPQPLIKFDLYESAVWQDAEICNSVFVGKVRAKKVRRCFICIAKAFQLGRKQERFQELLHAFSCAEILAWHFTSPHLDGLREDETCKCPWEEDEVRGREIVGWVSLYLGSRLSLATNSENHST